MGRYFRRSTASDWARLFGMMTTTSVIVFIFGFFNWHGDNRTRDLVATAFMIVCFLWAWVHFADQTVIRSVRYQCSCGKPLVAWSTHYYPRSSAYPYDTMVPIKPGKNQPVRYYAVDLYDMCLQLASADTEHDVWTANGQVASMGLCSKIMMSGG